MSDSCKTPDNHRIRVTLDVKLTCEQYEDLSYSTGLYTLLDITVDALNKAEYEVFEDGLSVEDVDQA